MLPLRRSLLVAALGLAACAAPADDAATSDEAALTRSVVTYAFTNATGLGYLQGLALGPPRDGAMLLAEDYAPSGNVTTPKLWDGTKLSKQLYSRLRPAGGPVTIVFDTARVVGLCDTISRGARMVEWDGQARQIGELEAELGVCPS